MRSSSSTTQFGFRIRTRQGLIVEHLKIHGRDEADAERKLRQIYLHCEILERSVMRPAVRPPGYVHPRERTEGASFEEIVSLISK
ncbi:MAG: hypothetical protein WBO23_02855 [Burkholderiales bacterium]